MFLQRIIVQQPAWKPTMDKLKNNVKSEEVVDPLGPGFTPRWKSGIYVAHGLNMNLSPFILDFSI